jgi:hypothetical protein
MDTHCGEASDQKAPAAHDFFLSKRHLRVATRLPLPGTQFIFGFTSTNVQILTHAEFFFAAPGRLHVRGNELCYWPVRDAFHGGRRGHR